MNKVSKNTPVNADETPKVEVAKSVVTPKKRYFYPEAGKTVEATSKDEADKLVKEK